MITPKEKQQTLNQLRPKFYQIYGIFNFKSKELVFVSLDLDEVELEFNLEGYDDGEDCDVVKFRIAIC